MAAIRTPLRSRRLLAREIGASLARLSLIHLHNSNSFQLCVAATTVCIMVQVYPLLALQLFASSVIAQQRVVPRTAEATPFIPGQVSVKKAAAPQPTSPPQVLRKALLARDAATCGWMMADGSPNVCGENQYCYTAASGEFGVWNCCNPGSCYTATGCTKDREW